MNTLSSANATAWGPINTNMKNVQRAIENENVAVI